MQPRYSARGKVARNVMRAGRRSRPPCTTLGSPFRSSDGQRKFQLKLRARHQSGRTYSIVVGMCTVIGRRGIEPRFTQLARRDFENSDRMECCTERHFTICTLRGLRMGIYIRNAVEIKIFMRICRSGRDSAKLRTSRSDGPGQLHTECLIVDETTNLMF